ncbi:MAG: hypothetical protein AAF569_00435 [Pseudomonadota bacterium]
MSNLDRANEARGRNGGRTTIKAPDVQTAPDFQAASTNGGLLDRIGNLLSREPAAEPEVCDPSLPEALANGTAAEVIEFNFPTDGAELAPSDLGQGIELLERFRDNGALTGYMVGCADTTASVEHNLALGQERADAVSDLLGQFGIQSNIVALSGGEACPTVGPDNTPSVNNRRTTVFLHSRPSGPQGGVVGGP